MDWICALRRFSFYIVCFFFTILWKVRLDQQNMHIQSDFFPACVKNASRSSKVYILVDIAPPTLHISNTENFLK